MKLEASEKYGRECESGGWAMDHAAQMVWPSQSRERHNGTSHLDIHHVVPYECGGEFTDIANVLLLCPNCHRTAHHISSVSLGAHMGPKTREELLRGLKLFRDEGAAGVLTVLAESMKGKK